MKFQTKFIAFVGALALASSSYAAFKAPPNCPNISVIKAEGVSNAEKILDHIYVDYKISPFDTDSTWIFAVGPFTGNSAEEALDEGNKALATLSGHPNAEPDQSGWLCLYEMSEKRFAVALLADGSPSLSKLRKFWK